MAESPLLRAILWSLVPGQRERFDVELSADLDFALKRALTGPQPVAELSDALRMIVALETRLGSPAAGARLRGWLRRSNRALDIIRNDIAGAQQRWS